MVRLRVRAAVSVVLSGLAALAPRSVEGQVGTAFTYQGRLSDAGSPANGPYDFQFLLYDAAVGGAQQGPIVTQGDVAVAAGLFTVSLDFGAVFSGARRYLEMAVRPGASTGSYTPLGGRQELTPGPNAVYGSRASWNGLIGVPAGFADGVDNDSGDITQVTAGTGLTGGGAIGSVTLSADLAGSGTATTISRSDHNHFGQSWTGSNAGAALEITNSSGRGIVARSTSLGGNAWGVFGIASSQLTPAVYGQSLASSNPRGVAGDAQGEFGIGVTGTASWIGVSGFAGAPDGSGVRGQTLGTTGSAAGVYGAAQASVTTGATGVWGVQGPAAGSWAGYFSGRAHVNGTLSKVAGSFKIDHPLDPENKYLSHSFVESPDMMNVYNGNVTLDAEGQAEVALPDWFEALNQEFRYQLTPIGAPGPSLHVARKIAGNRFSIGGGSPGLEVSWQVTGIRHDAYARWNRIPVEETKPEHERGVYLQPEAHGVPKERGLDHRRQPREISVSSGTSQR